MKFLSDLDLQEDGLVVPGNLSIPSPTPTHQLIGALRDKTGDPSTVMPAGSYPEDAVWLRGQRLSTFDLTHYSHAYSALHQVGVDEVLQDLWHRLRSVGEPAVSVQPIFLTPVYTDGDERDGHYLTGKYLTYLLMSHVLIVTCASGGNNCTGLQHDFEEVSAAAMIERCVHLSRCLDLEGIHISFKDSADEFMRRLVGAHRTSTI